MDRAQMLDAMKEWGGGKPETPCGKGSTMASTVTIRRVLPTWFQRYNIHSLADVGCGDQGWINTMDRPPGYQGFDLIPRHPGVIPFDLTSEDLPLAAAIDPKSGQRPYDAILCRHVLNHLPVELVLEGLRRFRKAAPILILTQHDGVWSRVNVAGHYCRYDLTAWPFELGKPLEIEDDVKDSRIALWRV